MKKLYKEILNGLDISHEIVMMSGLNKKNKIEAVNAIRHSQTIIRQLIITETGHTKVPRKPTIAIVKSGGLDETA